MVIWGAGRIGRGFVADIFSQAEGFHTVFVDKDPVLVKQLTENRSYTVARATRGGIEETVIRGFEADHTGDSERLKSLFCEPELLLDIAVHEPRLGEVADMLVPLMKLRCETGLCMDIMMNVNAHRPDLLFRDLMRERLYGDVLAFFETQVGVTGIFAMCISPFAPDWLKAKDALAVWNNGWETQTISFGELKCAPPLAPRLLLTSDIEKEETRKLYTLNMAHAFLSYLGLPLGLKTSFEAVNHKELRPELLNALKESCAGLEAKYGFSPEEMTSWREKILALLENPYIEDDLQRLGADTRRKIGPRDRLLGPARLALEAGVTPASLFRAIRAAFEYENPDEGTQAVRRCYKLHGLAAALEAFCGLAPGEELYELLLNT